MGTNQATEGLNSTKWWRKSKFSLSAWAKISIFSCPWTVILLVLWPSELSWVTQPAFLILWLTDDGSQNFLASIIFKIYLFLASIIVWANFCNKSFCICLSVYNHHDHLLLILFFWGTPTNTWLSIDYTSPSIGMAGNSTQIFLWFLSDSPLDWVKAQAPLAVGPYWSQGRCPLPRCGLCRSIALHLADHL